MHAYDSLGQMLTIDKNINGVKVGARATMKSNFVHHLPILYVVSGAIDFLGPGWMYHRRHSLSSPGLYCRKCMLDAFGSKPLPCPQKRIPVPSRNHQYLIIDSDNGVNDPPNVELGSKHLRNGKRKPNVPIEKLSTGGTAPALNNDEAWRIVPSPPSVTTRSIFSALGALPETWD